MIKNIIIGVLAVLLVSFVLYAFALKTEVAMQREVAERAMIEAQKAQQMADANAAEAARQSQIAIDCQGKK